MQEYRYNQQGFTLIEVTISSALLVLLLLAVVAFSATIVPAALASNNRVEAQQTARIAGDAIVRELRYAQKITVPFNGQTGSLITFIAEDNQTITFQLGTTSGLNMKTLYRIKNSGVNPISSNSITNFKISRSARYMEISFDIIDITTGKTLTTSSTAIVCVNTQ